MENFITGMKVLSDPNRVKMLNKNQIRVLYLCEIQEAPGLAQLNFYPQYIYI